MKTGLLAQLSFTVLAAVAVYCFVATAKDAQARRACVPVCSLHPAYAARNRTAPDFELPNLAGEAVRLSGFRGKTVILNFWTTSCPPCLEEMPSVAELAKILRARRDVVVLTVSTDPDRATAETTLRTVLEEKAPFDVLLDPDQKVVGDLYGTHLFPETWIIDPDGVIRARFDGARDYSSGMMLDLIDSLRLAPACQAEFSAGQASPPTTELCEDAS
jgi:peroxiredoxin